MPRRTVIIPVLGALLTSGLLIASVFAQEVPGGPDLDTNLEHPFNACLLDTCEAQRARCTASAGGDAALLAICEAYVMQCIDACRAGDAGYVFPPLPSSQPDPVPVPEPLPEPIVAPEPAPLPVPEPEPEPVPVPTPLPVTETVPDEEPEPEPPAAPPEERDEEEEPSLEMTLDLPVQPTGEELAEETREETDALIREMADEDVFRRIPEVMSLGEGGEDEAEWKPSQEEPGQDVSEYVILIGDLDDDGLPDGIEDFVPEGDPTAEALSSGAPLGQPQGAGEEDPEFTVEESQPQEGMRILRGHCDPDAICLIYVYSYVPVVLAVKTDASGNYVYDISDYVGSGSHVAYVTVTDKTGKIAKKSSPFSFVVEEAQAADAPEALPVLDVDVEEATPDYLIWYVLGATGLVLIGVGLALSLRKRAP